MLGEIYLEAARECIGDHKSVPLDADVPAPSRTTPIRYRCKTTRGVMGLHELMSAIISQVKDIKEDDLQAKSPGGASHYGQATCS